VIRLVGTKVIAFVTSLGALSDLCIQLARALFRRPFPVRITFEQMVRIGWNSLPVVFFTAIATGAILALQTGYALMSAIKGTEQFVGGIVSITVTRELGPMLCAIMVAGRAGSGITAEIGTMRVTEQIDALRTLSTDPVQYLVVPRVLAGLLMLPILTLITDAVAIIGGMLVAFYELGLNETQYIDLSFRFMTLRDVTDGLVKSVAFGLLITLLACFEGFRTGGGAEGVGRATTRAVVAICMSILFADYALTSLMT
jgi:phospholipid/cholesterol/gamma-HCH transport system permease protein